MSKHYKTYRINDYLNEEPDWLTKSLLPDEDYTYDIDYAYDRKTIDPYTYTVQNKPYTPRPAPHQNTTTTTATNNATSISTYLPWGATTSNVLNGITEAYSVGHTGFNRKSIDSITPKEFNSLENFESPEDIANRNVFIPGKLYRFNHEKTTHQYVVLMEDVEKDGTTIVLDARDKETFDGKVFLCLETRWVDGPVTTIARKGVTKFIDRLWQTVFLSGSKTYTFFWFENPQEAEHYGNVQACTKFWNAHLGVLMKSLAGNLGNAVGMSVAGNLLSYPNTPSPATTSTTVSTSPTTPGLTTTSITSTWGWTGYNVNTPAPGPVVANKTIPTEESFFAMPSREMFIQIS